MPSYAQVKSIFPPPDPAPYAWIIDKDHLFEPAEQPADENDKDTIGPSEAPDGMFTKFNEGWESDPQIHQFEMFDDDGELYYSGRFFGDPTSDDGFGPLDDFGRPNAGCTEIKYLDKETGAWETL